MTARKALIQVDGQLMELPVGDTLTGAGATAATAAGVAVVDFGPHPGNNEAMVIVPAADGDVGTPRVFIHGDDAVGTHGNSDHRYAPLFIAVTAGDITNFFGPGDPATGFAIYARSQHKMQGQFKVRWIY